MMAVGKAIKPVYEVMAQAGEKFDPKAYLPAVTSYYSDTQGRLLSMPFNSSTPVFFYNKDAFKKAGLDPNKPPQDLGRSRGGGAEAQGLGHGLPLHHRLAILGAAGDMSAWHNLPFASKQNGFGGMNTKLDVQPGCWCATSRISSWVKSGYFTYAGRTNQPDAKFSGGDCAMLTSSSSALREHQAQRQVRLRRVAAAVLRGRPGRAAELRSSAAPACG